MIQISEQALANLVSDAGFIRQIYDVTTYDNFPKVILAPVDGVYNIDEDRTYFVLTDDKNFFVTIQDGKINIRASNAIKQKLDKS